jgi:membrane-anchored mycosin MYCP
VRLSARAATAVAATVAGVLLPAGRAVAADPPPCADLQLDTPVEQYAGTSLPLQLLGVEKSQKAFAGATTPGARVAVAVLDSGVRAAPGMDVVRGLNVTRMEELADWHGTAVAGIIAAPPLPDGSPVGIAPGARIVDVRVYDSGAPQPDPGERPVDPQAVAEGLSWVAQVAKKQHIKVANISIGVEPSRALAIAVRRAWKAGVVVVASTGNRPEEGGFRYDEFGGEVRRPGEDAGGLVFPAGYPHVVGVNATRAGEPSGTAVTGFVLPSSDTDVAAPTYGALTVGLNGATCVIPEVATSWSAAEVSGVLALLRSRYPGDRPAQAVARLLNTANGTTATPTRLTGVGVVQPYQALTRPLNPQRDGTVEVTTVEHHEVRAVPPPRSEDLLAATRDDAVWWGLVGGGVLVVALLLRPVLARRRGSVG